MALQAIGPDDLDPGGGALTATGHRVGRTYFSLHWRQRYRVVGTATVWELDPDGGVTVEWENGRVTTHSTPRGRDPELPA